MRINFKLIKQNKIIIALCAILLVFNLFAFTRAVPINSQLKINEEHVWGDYDRTVYRVFNIAKERADKPLFQNFDNLLYHGRNPAIFVFICEIAIRIGMRSPVPLQVISILAFNIGIILNFFLIDSLFKSKRKALLSAFFLSTTPYLLVYSSSIHAVTYEFLFFNATLLTYLKLLQSKDSKKQKIFLGLTLFSYFILTQNYYMYYVSTFICLFGLNKIATGKWWNKYIFYMAIIPIVSFMLVVTQSALASGGLNKGAKSITEIFVARTVDARLNDGDWYPDQKFITSKDYFNMPELISRRVADMFYLTPVAFLTLLAIAFILRSKAIMKNYRVLIIFPVFLAAGLFWNIVFFQHTFIHGFTGYYSFFAWSTIFAFAIDEIWSFVQERFGKEEILIKLFIFISIIAYFIYIYLLGFLNVYGHSLAIYLKNIIQLIL